MDKQENRRLTQIRESLGYSVTDFAKKLGIAQGSLSQIEKGEKLRGDTMVYVQVSKHVKSVLYQLLNVNPSFLEKGVLPMFKTNNMENETERLRRENAELLAENKKLTDELLSVYRLKFSEVKSSTNAG